MSTYVGIFKTFSKCVCDDYILNIVQTASLLAAKEVRFHEAGQDTDRVLCPGILRHYLSRLLGGLAPRQGFCLPGYLQTVYRHTVRYLRYL